MKTQDAPVDWRVTDSEGSFRWGYAGDELMAEWEGILVLRATRSGVLKALQPASGASPDLVEKISLGVAAAFLRAQRHQTSLHASAVSRRGAALVCIGASGVGKSTMAERLCSRPEVDLLGDDVTGIEVDPGGALRVVPSESAVWLTAAETQPKVAVRSVRAAVEPAILEGVVSLVFDDAVSRVELREIHGAEAVSVLLPSLMRFETTATTWARELDFVGHLIARTPTFQVARSRHVEPDAVADALLRLLRRKGR